jgi:hypothetical protein
MTDDIDPWENYESGPFCRHWGDPSDCDEECARCGHRCCRHGAESADFACMEEGCECEAWAQTEADAEKP